ncbi:MAG: matrixin family metalloprotease, partial [Myxococcota bacterium]
MKSLRLAIGVLLTLSGCGRTVTDVQRDSLERYRPKAEQQETRAVATASVTCRVAVLADQGYRNRNPNWRSEVVELFREINRYSVSQLGVRFAVERRDNWEHQLDTNALGKLLEELERDVPGHDFDFVLGLAPADSRLVLRPDQLGLARVFGKHAVVRAMDDSVELESFRETYDQIDEEEIRRVYYQRKRHKERSIFLHEWAHTLGLPHVRSRADLMFPAYSADEAGFAPTTVDVIQESLGYQKRLPRTNQLAFLTEWAQAVATRVRETPEHWDSADFARYDSDSADTGLLAGRSYLSGQASELLATAIRATEGGRYEDAATLLAAIRRDYPQDPAILAAQCRLDSVQRLDAVSEGSCRAAAEVGDPIPIGQQDLVCVDELSLSDHRVSEHEVLLSNRDRVAAHPSSAAYWNYYAAIAVDGDLGDHADAALEALGENGALTEAQAERLHAVRRRYGTSSAPDAEYLTGIRAVWSLLGDGDYAAVIEQSHVLEAEHPAASGPPAIRCVAEAYAARRSAARSCERALELDPEQSTATWGMALVAMRSAASRKPRPAS